MKRTFIIVSVLILIGLCGCPKKSKVEAPQQAPPKTAAKPARVPDAVIPAIAPEQPAETDADLKGIPSPSVSLANSYDLAEMNFESGKFSEAAHSIEEYLKDNPKPQNLDRALFQLGMSRLLSGDLNREMRRAEPAFKRLIAEFPNSPYKRQAEFILGLQAQIEKLKTDVQEREERLKRLSEELQKLKEIDMQRRPSRPPQ
jgi:TolA-binding protein